MAASVRDARAADAAAIAGIQNALLATTAIEWTDTPHTADERAAWVRRHQEAGEPVLVAEVDGDVVGFAAYGEFRDSTKWPGYRLTVEHTIHQGLLMSALIEHASAASESPAGG